MQAPDVPAPADAPASTSEVAPAPDAGLAPAGPRAGLHRRALGLRSTESLDWPRIIEALAEQASTAAGERLCRALPFLESPDEARRALAELAEMLDLRGADAAPPLGGIEDVAALLGAIGKGEVLDGASLLRVAHTIEGLGRLHIHALDHAERLPLLLHHAQQIRALPDLAAWLVSSFDNRGELSASTYPQLTSLRSKKASLHGRIQSRIQELQSDERFVDSLQDDFIAMRNDRYVIPVRSRDKRAGLGIVQDASGSGQTVFLEPWEVVELNNDLKIADAELAAEERRILRDLCERVALVAPDLRRGLRAAAHLDLVHSKARLAERLDATVPTLPDQPRIRLLAARHPVLALRGLDVVPNDLDLGAHGKAMIISGPNTGGKTITLKTLGLAALLVRAGLAVPCAPGSEVGWFPHVLTDIGDLQDVEGDLSTFSAHVLSLVQILDELDRDSDAGLVLIDEIAAGTDPVQGAALARAVLLAMLQRGVLLATTTHFASLKAVAAADPRFVNARVEFDPVAGRPTYRLSVGQPGGSHAFDIAAQVGLPRAILDNARSFLDPHAADVEAMLGDLDAAVEKARAAEADAERLRDEARRKLEEASVVRRDIHARSRDLKKTLRAEFEREVEDFRGEVRGALKELRAERTVSAAERAREQINAGTRSLKESWAADEPAVVTLDPESLIIGQRVRVRTLHKDGTLLEVHKGRVTVEVNGLRLQAAVSDLDAPRSAAPPARPTSPKSAPKARRPFAETAESPDGAFRSSTNTLDLRGQRVDEALDAVDRRLDDASRAEEPFVFLLHGHGTGVLKAAVRKHLRGSGYVASFVPGSRSQGGDGITVVEIK